MQIFFEMICAGGGGKDAAQAQGLRPFAMWLSAHVRAGVSGDEEGRRAGSRPAAFRYVAVGACPRGGKRGGEGRRAGSRPAAFRYVAVATYSSEKIRA